MAQLFEQQPKESAKAFSAFSAYLNMGPERSTQAVAKALAKSEQLVRRWSARWNWVERVQAQGAYIAAVVARGKAVEWAKRQQELREREWEMHERCIAAAKRGLDAYMSREKVYANLSDIARMLEVASKLGRLSSGLATDKTEVTGEDGGPIRLELEAALKKVYEQVEPAPIVEVEGRVISDAVEGVPTGGEK